MMERVRRHLQCDSLILCLLGLCLSVSFLQAQESTKSRGEIRHVAFESPPSARGPLLVVGGGLLPNNQAIFGKFIERAELGDRTHIGVLPTASTTLAGANRFAEILTQYGVSSSQIDVIPLFEPSAWNETLSLDLIERIRRCTAIYFVGGDQRRIVRALLGEDGTRSAALQAIDDVWKQGGIIGGTSAGAAVQCDVMISVSGLPNDSIDDGMDALDFGMTHSLASPARRGLLATTGLGYFPHGIIDQHFNQRRGRLARLARAIIEMQKPFGFGIDENTALMVQDNGQLEVVGTGTVTILKSTGARCNDGPLGCHITGVSVSCIEQGIASIHRPARSSFILTSDRSLKGKRATTETS